ncbi:MAG: hypothetical protein M1335_01870 [Chloroflexi bacterium]|nr:hypothetical protein [Chloroflexota bacterium]
MRVVFIVPLILLCFSAAVGLSGMKPGMRKASAVLAGIGALSLGWPALWLLANASTLGDLMRGVVLLAICVSSTLAAFHGLTYAIHWDHRPRAAVMAASFPVFVASMMMVVQASDFVVFLVAWEIMTITSALLVGIDHEEPANREAVGWYLAIGHLSPASFVLAVALLAPASFSWPALAAAASSATPLVRDVSFGVVLIGASAKAGLVPLHSWLPRAHPAAPSHVSAVMSGSMVTLGALAFIILGTQTLGLGSAWWGWATVVLGIASALTGALYALVIGDLKRLLAYSTVENMGLLFLEIGLVILANRYGLGDLKSLAVAAACVHIISHALAKSTLFLSAGSIIHHTGTRLLNRMGGVLKQNPAVSWSFIVAAGSIIALPPLAGFTGEWLLVRALMQAAASFRGLSGLAIASVLGLVALTGGFAMAAYAKAAGIGLLGSLRKEAPAHTTPVGRAERMVALAGASLVFVAPAVAAVLPRAFPTKPGSPYTAVIANVVAIADRSLYIAAGLLVLGGLAWVATGRRAFSARVADPWVCGLSSTTSRMQYTADSFSQPLARVFAAVLRPSINIDVDLHSASKGAGGRAYERRSSLFFDRALYNPIFWMVALLSKAVKRLHNGSVATYATWLMLSTLALMAYGRWGG